ncbi:MAG: hypothetical protein GY853_09880 [PVC group bacterium]|nr:hypothetical protein [PVC group bacterium]
MSDNMLILQELKQLNVEVNDVKTNVGTLLDRMSILETVVMGVNKDNGIHGSLKKIESLIENMKPNLNKLYSNTYDKDIGVNTRLKNVENDRDDYKKFKTRVYATVGTAQVFMVGIIYIINKFNLFIDK